MKITVPLKPDTVAHTCNPTTQKQRQEDRFGVILGYTAVGGQPGLHKICLIPKDTISIYPLPEVILFIC